jgi:hypothetical protein
MTTPINKEPSAQLSAGTISLAHSELGTNDQYMKNTNAKKAYVRARKMKTRLKNLLFINITTPIIYFV